MAPRNAEITLLATVLVILALVSSSTAFGLVPTVRGAGATLAMERSASHLQSSTASPANSSFIMVPPTETLFSVYSERPDLQAAYPNATENLTSLAQLVTWASEVANGDFPDSAFNQLGAPLAGYYYTLLSVYNDRLDLQAAFPDAYTNSSSYAGLLWWAGQVVMGRFVDSANATLGPWGFAYDLLATYVSRSDLQAAFPNALENLTAEEALTDWAGWAVIGAFPDSSNTTLQPYGYWYALMGQYDGRSDLQAAFPDAYGNATSYRLLVDWAGAMSIGRFPDLDQGNIAPEYGYYYDLMMVYDGRSDLQVAYPNAYTNSTSYAGLLVWAKDVVSGVFNDSAYSDLSLFASYFETGQASSWMLIGEDFAWAYQTNATGVIVTGCPSTTGHYCYTILIAGTGGNISTRNVLLALRNSTGALVPWPSAGITISLLSPTVVGVVATYSVNTSTWTLNNSFNGLFRAGDTLVFYTATTGANQGLYACSLLAVGWNGFRGVVASEVFS